MADYRRSKDDALLAEMYSTLLLETPVTSANIERFLKKYFNGMSPQHHQYSIAVDFAQEFLEKWTPRLQQIIKAAGGKSDIFAYSTIGELEDVIENSQSSKTEEKKAYKAATATDANIPLVQETDKYLVYQPLTWEASRKYFGINRISLLDGTRKKGARWCTSASTEANGSEYFKKYVVDNKDRLLYFIRKSDDELFAYRGEWKSQEHMSIRFESFIWSLQDKYVCDYIKCWRMLPENHPNKEFFFNQVWTGIETSVKNVAMYVNEVRSQSNALYNTLLQLYGDLAEPKIYTNFMEHVESFLKFVAFVIFGQTELTGFKQTESDEQLKKNAFTDASKRQEHEESYRPSRDELRLEAYKLLLETPATPANIQRFIKKYLNGDIFNPPGLTGDRAAMQQAANEHGAKNFLEKWTPRLQQIIKAAGGNPDIFAYDSLAELQRVIAASETSKTDVKKGYKNEKIENLPVVQETDKYIAYQPLTWEASKKYFGMPKRTSLLDGTLKNGATWCTSASDSDKFKEYVLKKKDRLIYFVRKKDDKLFAARSKTPTDANYQKWLKKADKILKDIKKIQSTPEYIALAAAAKKARAVVKTDDINWDAYDAIHKFDRQQFEIYTHVSRLEPAQMEECRDQKNTRIWRLYELLEAINGKKDLGIEEYVQFIKFVVFGVT